jgi:hypothetical protein
MHAILQSVVAVAPDPALLRMRCQPPGDFKSQMPEEWRITEIPVDNPLI